MNVISFSLWGDDPKYWQGALANVLLAREIYPDWRVWIYHDSSVPNAALISLHVAGAGLVPMRRAVHGWEGLFWRFLPAAVPYVHTLIVRDTDSRLNVREQAAVRQWLASDLPFHNMRDHIEHNVEIMGGLWGVRGGLLQDMEDLITAWPDKETKGADQRFLAAKVWPRVRLQALVHDCYHRGVIRLPEGQLVPYDRLQAYDPFDQPPGPNGEAPQYPHGYLILENGQVFQRLDCYTYLPWRQFGEHLLLPFPMHEPLEHGSYVGEIITP